MESPYGSRLRRFAAHLIDASIIGVVQVSGTIVSAKASLQAGEPGLLPGLVLWGASAWFLNTGILQGITGASFGKSLLGLEVVKSDGAPIGIGTSLLRGLYALIGALPLGAGYFLCLASREGLSAHDRLTGTVVIRKGAIYPVRPRGIKKATAESLAPPSLDQAA